MRKRPVLVYIAVFLWRKLFHYRDSSLTVLIGPQINVEVPIAMNTPALLMLIISADVLRSLAISGRAGKIEVLENATANVIQLVTLKMTTFRHIGSFVKGSISSIDKDGFDVPGDISTTLADISTSGVLGDCIFVEGGFVLA